MTPRSTAPTLALVCGLALAGWLVASPPAVEAAEADPPGWSEPARPGHPAFDLRDRLEDALENEVPGLREQVARNYLAAIAAKERCDQEGAEEAERLIDRMRQVRDYLAETYLPEAERLLLRARTPGFFSEYSAMLGAIILARLERIVDGVHSDSGDFDGLADHIRRIEEQIEAAEAYDPCSKPSDALPGDPEDAVPAPERGEKDKDQLEIASTSGRPVPGDEIVLVDLPDSPGEVADGGPDDDTQEQTDTVLAGRTYVVKATCHEEKIVSGEDLLEGDVQLEPKQRPLVLWVPIYIPRQGDGPLTEERLRSLEGPTNREVLDKAREVLKEKLGEDLDDYNVEIEPADTLLDDAGVWVYKVLLTAKRPPCPDALPEEEKTADPQIAGDPPPAGDDDPSIDPLIAAVPPGGTIEETVAREDKRPAAPTAANDPYLRTAGTWGQDYPDQWGLRRIGFGPGASLWPAAAEPVVVAVIDTGVDRSHPELRDAIRVNEGEIPGNGLDDDGNGYVDDVHGWNFADDSSDTRDINGHGTVTAGIIAAATGNGAGIAGVNPWARILPVRIAVWSGQSNNLRLAEAIRYSVDNGARVINISYGGLGRTWSEYLAVAYARSRGVIVVAAAGNDGAEAAGESPAGLPGVITVAATGPDDQRLGFSNWGPGVDIAAPGLDVLSLRARHTDLLRFKRDDYRPGAVIVGDDRRYYRLTGTSFSAPFVAGVASLILSLRPELTDMQVMRMVLHSARDIGTPGWDQYTGYGLLDAGAALAADPDFYLLARLSGVAVRQSDQGAVVEVSGRARADRFGRAWLELGRGESPETWSRVSEDLARPVDGGVVAEIPADRLRGSKTWTLRLIVEHAGGTRREARFALTLG